MKRNPYINDTWSERDELFYNSGLKGGMQIMTLLLLCAGVIAGCIAYDVKQERSKNNN